MKKHWQLKFCLIPSSILSLTALICMFLGYPPAVTAWILIPVLPMMLLLIKYPPANKVTNKVTDKAKVRR